MASIYKIPTGWRVQIRRKGFQTQTGVFETKADAERWARKVEVVLDRGENVAMCKETGVDLIDRYKREVMPTHKGARWEEVRLDKLKRDCPWLVRPAHKINRLDIQGWRDKRLQEVSADSVLRELNLLSSVFTYAWKEWGLIPANPCHQIKRPRQSPHRDRRVGDDEIAKLEAYFEKHQPPKVLGYVVPVVKFATETAMRLGEICALEWDNINLAEGWAFVAESKNGASRYVPLTLAARSILEGLPRLSRPFPMNKGSLSAAFREARNELGLEGLRLHDLRHEGTSRLARKLEPLELAKVVGHHDPKVTMIYYNPTPQELAAALAKKI